MIEHNPLFADTPDLPEEMKSKIGELAKVIFGSDSAQLPSAEPHCNCFHCQIVRAMQNECTHHSIPGSLEAEEEVHDDELRFKQFEIAQIDNQLYSVANPLDIHEKYTVYLGEPIGCTCGEKNCEHIVAVLRS